MNKQIANEREQAGLRLVPKPVQREDQSSVIREASTGRVVAVLPRVWAVAGSAEVRSSGHGAPIALVRRSGQVDVSAAAAAVELPKVELAFYRKYTEGMLRRYLRLSMEAGRVSSLLGREMFRGKVTSYKVRSFEDVVIFWHDMEKRLGRLDPLDWELIKRITLQEYTQGEAAGMLGLSLRQCIRRYGRALDRLTELLLEAKMLEPTKGCQEAEGRR